MISERGDQLCQILMIGRLRLRINYWIWQSERSAVLLTKVVLAEASREEMSREEIKVEPLETQDVTKGEQKNRGASKIQGSFFFL